MLGNLPKLLDRNFILGFFLPALFFAVAALLLLREYSSASSWLDTLLAKDVTSAAYAVAAVWLLAVALQLFNRFIYRVLEGYLPPFSWWAWAKRRYWMRVRQGQAEANALLARYDGLLPAERARYNSLRLFLSSMPTTEERVLPTRFGNAIGAFEGYATDVYGADSVVVWPHLASVASKDFASAEQDARTHVDFHLNCCVLSLLLAVLALWRTPFVDIARQIGQGWAVAAHMDPPNAIFGGELLGIWVPILEHGPFGKLIWFASACVAARAFYCFAVCAVPPWGAFVMAGFDCYLPKLAEQLGFALPRSDARRRKFWQQVSAMMIYRPLPGEAPFFLAEDWLFPPRQ